MRETLWHLTMNTGNVFATRRSELSALAISSLAPLITAGSGEIPGLPGFCYKSRQSYTGRAIFSISDQDGCDYVVCGVAWQQSAANELWQGLLEIARETHSAAEILRRPELPWLAGFLNSPLYTFTLSQFVEVYNIERCISWAILDRNLFNTPE